MRTKITFQQKIGRFGERIAEEYLVRQGYRVLEKNFKYSPFGEIDLIAQKRNVLHFIEVKTRKKGFGYPEEAVDQNKIDRIYRVITKYMEQVDKFREMQFDVISIELDYKERIAHLEHIKNFF